MLYNTIRYKYSISERKTKTLGTLYDLSFYYIDGRTGNRVQKMKRGFKTKKEARAFYTDFMTQQVIAPPTTQHTKLLYEDAHRLYLQSVKGNVKDSSFYEFVSTSKNYIDVWWKGRDILATTKQDVYAFQEWLKVQRTKTTNKPHSPTTTLKIYRIWTAFYNWCVERFDAPLIVVSAPRKQPCEGKINIWTRDDFDRFIAVVNNERHKAIFYTFFYCGLRCGELQALKPSDFDGKRFYVQRTYTRKTTDGNVYNITDTKNKKHRFVPVPSTALPVISSWAKQNAKSVFLFGEKDKPFASTSLARLFEKYIALADVPKIRIHDLRHSYVSMLISSGANFTVVAKLIGDTQEQVVKTYAHHIENDIENTISKI